MAPRASFQRLKHLIRPKYGKTVQITPKHWWSPKARKAARVLAAIAALHEEELRKEALAITRDRMLYGTSFKGPDGKRIDPGEPGNQCELNAWRSRNRGGHPPQQHSQ